MQNTVPEVIVVGASEVRVAVQGSNLLPTADTSACCCCSCCCSANRPK
jgi:hypothetical protein